MQSYNFPPITDNLLY